MSLVPIDQEDVGLNAADVQAGCAAALTAAIGGALVTTTQVEGSCTAALNAAIGGALVTTTQVEGSCTAALTAAIGGALVTTTQVEGSCTAALNAAIGGALLTSGQVQAAAAAAIAGAGLATTGDVAGVPAAVAARLLGIASTFGVGRTPFSFGVGTVEGEVMAPIAGRRFQIHGFVAILSTAAGNVAIRSGLAVGDAGNSNLSASYPMIVGVPLPLITNASDLPLWTTLDNQGIYVGKPNAAICVGEVWWSAPFV